MNSRSYWENKYGSTCWLALVLMVAGLVMYVLVLRNQVAASVKVVAHTQQCYTTLVEAVNAPAGQYVLTDCP